MCSPMPDIDPADIPNPPDATEDTMTDLRVPDSPKAIRETLCTAQARIAESDLDEGRKDAHIKRLGRLIDECERHRPLGPDGKHGERHTPTCGCDLAPRTGTEDGRE